MKIRRFCAALILSASLVGGGTLLAAPAHAADNCYSWNKDTPACGWYGPPAPNIPLTCKIGVATSMWSLMTGNIWGGLFGGTVAAAGCAGY